VLAAEVIRETDARGKSGCIVILVSGVATGAAQSVNAEFVCAATVDEGILAAVSEVLIQVADVAELIVEGAKLFDA